jgi:Pyruvate/2-oxoacid:ferredoxin oxidoreductase gamma subunit
MATNPKVLIAMNRPSLDKFEKDVLPGGVIFYNSSLIDVIPKRTDVEIVPIKATDIADELGNVRVANMVALGAYIGYTGLLDKDDVVKALSDTISRKNLIPLNEQAIIKGMESVKS